MPDCMHRAKAAAEAVGGPQDDHGVPAGSYVVVHIARVPSAAAAALVARVTAYLQVLLPSGCAVRDARTGRWRCCIVGAVLWWQDKFPVA